MSVAFLGLGAIGRPMAARVAVRHPLVVWNRTAARAQEFARQTACRVAGSPAEAVREADVVMTCLSTSLDVESLLDGPEGLLAGLRPGTLFLDCTSGDPAGSNRIARRLAERGVAFADCPVSGGTNGAEAGTLTVMVGGDPAVFERARPYLECFGKLIVHLGAIGAGDTIKAINQVLLAANILSLGEALTAMVKAGVPARAGLEVLNASSGRSFVSESLVPARVLTGAWPNTFRLALMDKDVGIALDLIDQLGLDTPLLDLVRDRTRAARAALGEQADYLEPIKLNERAAGVEVRG
ncbi:MAG: NAD(P)-dependent oxidoreductase [Gemmatimonadetes bacterium]|nr:NAD(P)-dependent oxidoreductase [Gemmatimonadota bacterium]